MDEIIQIKCPFDGAILSVKNQPGIETKNVTCPACKHKYPFTQYKRVGPILNIQTTKSIQVMLMMIGRKKEQNLVKRI